MERVGYYCCPGPGPDYVLGKHTFLIFFPSCRHAKMISSRKEQGFGGSHLGHIFSIMDDFIENILLIEGLRNCD